MAEVDLVQVQALAKEVTAVAVNQDRALVVEDLLLAVEQVDLVMGLEAALDLAQAAVLEVVQVLVQVAERVVALAEVTAQAQARVLVTGLVLAREIPPFLVEGLSLSRPSTAHLHKLSVLRRLKQELHKG